MSDKLRLTDYLNKPLLELANHADFDEKFFWIAANITDAPMRDLAERIDQEWLNGIITSA